MIRRRLGGRWLLFTQDDHARLAADLARHVGGAIARPAPFEPFHIGVALHDAGWPLHDDAPTLNPAGEPLDVFEVTRDIALPVWSASADRAQAADPYAGLLASLHVFSLSVYATSATSMKHEKFDTADARERFAINQFQHNEIERQETLRKRLALRTDVPLRLGLAEESTDSREQKLTFDLKLLQAMDQLSLAICCDVPPAMELNLHPRPGAAPIKLRLFRPHANLVTVDPWPFDVPRVEVTVPYIELPATRFDNLSKFRDAFAKASGSMMHVQVARPK